MPATHAPLITPYGGKLVDLLVTGSELHTLKEESSSFESVTLSDRQLCDLEMLAVGAFSPLTTFMNQADYQSVLDTMRVANGTLFPMPITLPVDRQFTPGERVALKDGFGNLLAVLKVDEVYLWDPHEFASKVLGTTDEAHNLVRELRTWGQYNLSGKLIVLALPTHKDFANLRLTPVQVRERLVEIGDGNVVAFQTRNPLHRAHEEMTKRAATLIKGTLLLHPVVGMTKPGDVDHVTRVRCYMALIDNHYSDQKKLLSLLPLAMRMAGPREAVWHAIIRRNYGASYFISGRDHAGPGKDSSGKPFYAPFEARDLAKKHETELGMTIFTFGDMAYVEDDDRYENMDAIPKGKTTRLISGTQVREDYLAKGRPLPTWFTCPEVAAILADAYPPSTRQGFCLWLTGLSGAGKSTIAQGVQAALEERGRRTTMLDGDIVRQNLSKGLGFSRPDRETNIKRVGYVASRVVYHHGVAICALISPYQSSRQEVRALFDRQNFIEIYVDTPIDICEQRDPKGHYQNSRQGKIANFTGIDDTYEAPANPELVIDTTHVAVTDSVTQILTLLQSRGFIT
ncbi:MAG TPA: bifunctional sulfate adenylyltransferase/adenylylsulfate kinase [Candidatus Saccharimonadia bacterium]|nr:bifunctional sulfate adenylyltransferase/adenylylsulfate kinase [Candidatus Saccharimonadia bacterium]